MPTHRMPDELDRRILRELGKDARVSMRAIAERLGVSTPTVSQRVRRMEEAGLILGYRVVTSVDPSTQQEVSKGWSCAHCKGPIRGSAVVRKVEQEHRPFCCPVCARIYTERYEMFREKTTKPRGG